MPRGQLIPFIIKGNPRPVRIGSPEYRAHPAFQEWIQLISHHTQTAKGRQIRLGFSCTLNSPCAFNRTSHHASLRRFHIGLIIIIHLLNAGVPGYLCCCEQALAKPVLGKAVQDPFKDQPEMFFCALGLFVSLFKSRGLFLKSLTGRAPALPTFCLPRLPGRVLKILFQKLFISLGAFISLPGIAQGQPHVISQQRLFMALVTPENLTLSFQTAAFVILFTASKVSVNTQQGLQDRVPGINRCGNDKSFITRAVYKWNPLLKCPYNNHIVRQLTPLILFFDFRQIPVL